MNPEADRKKEAEKKKLERLRESYREIAKTPAGKNLLEYLDVNYDRLVREAERQTDPVKAFYLLQNARGLSIVREYVARMSEELS